MRGAGSGRAGSARGARGTGLPPGHYRRQKDPVCAQQPAGALPGPPPAERTHSRGPDLHFPQSPKVSGAARALQPPSASIRPPAPGRTPPGASGSRKGKSEAGLRHPPSCCPKKTTPLLWGWATASPPPLRSRQPASPQFLSPSQQLPRGPGPRAGTLASPASWAPLTHSSGRGAPRGAPRSPPCSSCPGRGLGLRQEVRWPLTL